MWLDPDKGGIAMTDLPSLAEFQARLNEQFMVPLADHSFYPLTLIEVTALPHKSAPAIRSDPFEMKFRGPGPGYLPQQIHQLHNEALGLCPVFLVPIGRDGDGFLYQAIFN
jgi:hypothetical protein